VYGATGTAYTAEFWEYDPRAGRRWNMDPVDKPWMSPYHAFSNSPIWKIDPNGALDTKYQDEAGNLIHETRDGSDAVMTIDNDKVEAFKQNLQGLYERGEGDGLMHQYGLSQKYGVEPTAQAATNSQSTSYPAPTDGSAVSAPQAASAVGGFGISPIGPTLILLGAPLLPKPGGVGGGGTSGPWTSPAAKGLRWADASLQRALGTSKQLPAGGFLHRTLGTRGIGAAAGRAVPLLGWGITAAETGWELGRTIVETETYQEFRRETLMPLRSEWLGY